MRIIRVGGFFLVLMVFAASTFAFDNGDFQYWNTESVSWKIHKVWKLSLIQEFRSVDDGGNLYYYHTSLVTTYSGIAKWIDLGARFRKASEERSGEWKDEVRPALECTLKYKLPNLSISNRIRFEYRDREDAEDYWRYRNKFTLKPPIKFTRFAINPYVADELFYDFNANMLNKNRLYSGFTFKITRGLGGEVYYLWQTDKKRVSTGYKWKDTNILGTKLKLSF